MKKIIENIPPSIKTEKSFQLSERLSQFFSQRYSTPVIIGGFAPLADEVHWEQGDMQKWKESFSFPYQKTSGDMGFKKATFAELKKAKEFGVELSTPDNSASEVSPVFLIVPGLAFDESGWRLGRGKGFYDKYLENFSGEKVGVCFEEQIQPSIPTEFHDQKVNFVITDKRIITVKG